MKLHNKGEVNYVMIGAVGLVVLVLGLGFWLLNSDDEEDVATNNAPGTEVVETSEPADLPSGDVLAEKDTANLVAVGNYTGSGTATRTTTGGYVHEVVATLGPPAEGDFYEGWVVGPSIVSSGRLVNEGGDQWSLIFASDEDLSGHNRVVITEETEANGLDGIPEDHVLEGSF